MASTRGPYTKTPLVRERILESALRVFSESGFRGTTMKAVAEHAGISQRGLVHHFRSKEELLIALLDRHDVENVTKVPAEPGVGVLDAMLRVARDNSAKPGMLELHSILSAEATSADHPAHAHFVARYDGYRAYLTDSFELMRANGLLHSDLPSEVLAAMFIAAQDGLQLQWLYNPDAVDVEGALRRLVDSWTHPSTAVATPR